MTCDPKCCKNTKKQQAASVATEGIMIAVRFGSAAALLAAVVAVTPATAGKRDNSLRAADEQVLHNADPYFNSVRIGGSVSPPVSRDLLHPGTKTAHIKATP